MKKTDYEFKYVGSCPVCSARYAPRNLAHVGKKANMSQVHARCFSCKSSTMIFVVRNASGFVTTIGMLTDMSLKDAKRFRTMQPITSDDLIELHKTLEGK
ncbi:MAG: hypothetical protein A2932_01865 [Candidatus Spechtbacteria bacterium RIFCSPLOWO2_01_FULL_46_10]|uniref:Uncharacterized protein n=1 Tax=Candidatus Spechtbacteria bacterium RIFCSPLOWO2_01_FULL_46_10 TaxID=1802163 RepID=A0A1G2HJ68_9BACT|nr:MAG: hypothetical protein A2932_01865 [Candidatus Spechtbacteria bacterium RIFCSPLOWO2_01_FULL_46_10]